MLKILKNSEFQIDSNKFAWILERIVTKLCLLKKKAHPKIRMIRSVADRIFEPCWEDGLNIQELRIADPPRGSSAKAVYRTAVGWVWNF